MTSEEARAHMDMLIAHKDKALKTHTYFNGATNGDVIKAVFPNATVYSFSHGYCVYSDEVVCPQNFMMSTSIDWWNAPYKGGEEDEN